MRITIFILMSSLMQISASVYSQPTKLNVDMKSASLVDVLDEIKAQSEFSFIHRTDLFNEIAPVDLKFLDVTIEEILDKVVVPQGYEYEIIDNVVIIRKIVESPEIITQPIEQQQKTIKGKVTDGNDEPLPGVSIVLKGTAIGVATDVEGNYSLELPDDAQTLVFSFIGFETKEVEIGNLLVIDVLLKEMVNSLDAVQIIGYSTTTKRFNTSGIASIKGETIEDQAISTNFMEGLQGRLTGVNIKGGMGSIGNSPEFVIRGTNSLTSGTKPLILMDGVIVSQDQMESFDLGSFVGSHNALSSIDPSIIESIEVLKDADATAIYGSRGANGVILITTKSPEFGKLKVTFDASTGFNTSTKISKMANLENYLAVRREAFEMDGLIPDDVNAPDLTQYSQTIGTDYSKWEYGNIGRTNAIRTSLTGGNRDFSFIVSGGFQDIKDVQNNVFDPFNKKATIRGEIRHQGEKFKFTYRNMFSYEHLEPGNASNAVSGGVAFKLPPNFPLYDADGQFTPSRSLGGNMSWRNPLWSTLLTQWSKTWDYLTSADISYEIFKGLTLKANIAYNLHTNQAYKDRPEASSNPAIDFGINTGIADFSDAKYQSWNFEPLLSYTTNINKFKINALAGSTWSEKTMSRGHIQLDDYITEALFQSWPSSETVILSNSMNKYKFHSWYGRLNTIWDNKYILNLSGRADGSTRFSADGEVYALFWAVGGGWIFSEEKFIKDKLAFLSFGKLRSSYGVTGNDQIPDYQYLNLFRADPKKYIGNAGFLPSFYPNRDLRWESTTKFEIALELGLFNNNISTTFAYFKNLSKDLLQSLPVSGQSGFGSQIRNFDGIVENTGFEFEFNSNNMTTDNFSWNTYFNLSIINNKLVEYPDLETSAQKYNYIIDKPLSYYRERVLDYIDPDDGNPVWLDIDGDPTSTNYPLDYQYIGPKDPVAFGGLGNTFIFKSISLDIFFTFAQQVLVDQYYNISDPGLGANFPVGILGNYWQNPGDVAQFPRLSTISNVQIREFYTNGTHHFHNTLWFRLKNVNLTYNLPESLLKNGKISRMSVYAKGQNLFYMTPGVDFDKDPEQSKSGILPPLRTVVFGIKLSF